MGIIRQIIDEPGYVAERSGVYVAGKNVVTHGIAHPMGEALGKSLEPVLSPAMADQIGSLAAGSFGNAMIGLTSVGLIAGFSAGLTQMDYYHNRNKIKEAYKEELASKLNKPVQKITTSDLDMLAKGDPAKNIAGNRTIAKELSKAQKERNFGIGFSFIASMAALGVATFVLPMAAHELFNVAFHPATLSQLFTFTASAPELGALGISSAIGLGTYYVVKAPLHWIGDKLFGLGEETPHERIVEIKREREAGKAISPEQVLSVFAIANPQLDRLITAQYGESFDKIPLAAKQQAVQELGKVIPLDQLAQGINAGKINVTELAFSTQGDLSGVEHKDAPQPRQHGVLGAMWNKVRGALSFRPHPQVDVGTITVTQPTEVVAMGAEERSGSNFVQRMGLAKADTKLGFAERLRETPQTTELGTP